VGMRKAHTSEEGSSRKNWSLGETLNQQRFVREEGIVAVNLKPQFSLVNLIIMLC